MLHILFGRRHVKRIVAEKEKLRKQLEQNTSSDKLGDHFSADEIQAVRDDIEEQERFGRSLSSYEFEAMIRNSSGTTYL